MEKICIHLQIVAEQCGAGPGEGRARHRAVVGDMPLCETSVLRLCTARPRKGRSSAQALVRGFQDALVNGPL